MKKDEIETIARSIGLGFLYGNAQEINNDLENLPLSDYPVLLYIAPVEVTDTINTNNAG